MQPASAKKKARRLQNQVAELIRSSLDLSANDVRPAIMGEAGQDIKLSDQARLKFPVSLECKNCERIRIWQALDQADQNCEPGLVPAVAFSKNRSDVYIALELTAFLDLLNHKLDL